MYPYKCRNFESNTVELPYVKKKDTVCDHKYTLTYREWNKIYKAYVKIMTLYLRQGFPYKLPHYMGTIKLVKMNSKFYSYLKKRLVPSSNFLFGKSFRPMWYKAHKQSHLKYKWYWKLLLCYSMWTEIYEWLKEDPVRIKNLSDK